MNRSLESVPDARMTAVFNLLSEVPGQAWKKGELAARFCLNPREVELTIQALRVLWGAPIRSGGAGYWWPRNRDEALLVADELRNRTLEQHRTEGAVRRGVDVYFPPRLVQASLFAGKGA